MASISPITPIRNEASPGNDSGLMTFDLHYHANISRMPRHRRTKRLQSHYKFLKKTGVDFVASTEHSFKKPLEAYLFLSELSIKLPTVIIPGVECISREGIDIIFLYKNESDLRSGLKCFGPFSWSIKDINLLADYTGAIVIVPHPFFMGRTGAGNVLSSLEYRRLLDKVNYVEIHNGGALLLMDYLSRRGPGPPFKEIHQRIIKSLHLPRRLRGAGLGWSIGSDAHYPGEQHVVGLTRERIGQGESVFDLLARNLRFEMAWVHPTPRLAVRKGRRLFRTLRCASFEGITKNLVQLKNEGLSAGKIKDYSV